MRKIATVLFLAIVLTLSANAQFGSLSEPSGLSGLSGSTGLNMRGEKHPMLHAGFFIRAGLFMPGSRYYYPTDLTSHEEEYYTENAANPGFNFQVGTSFYFGPPIANFLRFGLDATWLDLSLATLANLEDANGITMDMKFVGVGPLVSISPMRKIAIDTYLKVLPTINLYTINYSDDGYEDSDASTYVGVNATYLFGIGFRFTKLNVGFETNWGNVEMNDANSDLSDESYGKLRVNNARIYIGVRF